MVAMCVCMCSVRLFGLLGLFLWSLSAMRLHFGRFCENWLLMGLYVFHLSLYVFGVVIWACQVVSVEFVRDEIAFRTVL